jgi:TIR domain
MRVFISHASTDAALARRIASVLRQAGLKVWDDTQVLPGENWGKKLGEALQESEAMVVLWTSDAVRSPNVHSEVGYALGQAGYKGRLISVFATPREQLPKEGVPWVLNRFPMIDLSDPERDAEGLRKLVQMLHEANAVC